MTNNNIVLSHAIELMNRGIIGTTGKFCEIEDKEGNKKTIQEPEPIHTFAGWKARGFQVKRGQTAVVKFPIWRHQAAGTHINRKTGMEEETGEKMCLTEACFFSESQVQPIEN